MHSRHRTVGDRAIFRVRSRLTGAPPEHAGRGGGSVRTAPTMTATMISRRRGIMLGHSGRARSARGVAGSRLRRSRAARSEGGVQEHVERLGDRPLCGRSHHAVRRHRTEQLLQRLEPTRGRADADDRKISHASPRHTNDVISLRRRSAALPSARRAEGRTGSRRRGPAGTPICNVGSTRYDRSS